MKILAGAVARTVSNQNGLLLLELPDGLEGSFLGEIVSEADAYRKATDGAPYAILLSEASGAGSARVEAVDSRGLPQYRQGDRLVVCHAKDYRAQATFATVLAPALPVGFPKGDASAEMVQDVALELASSLLGPDAEDADLEDLAAPLFNAMRLVARAYEVEVESGVEWRARWWKHAGLAIQAFSHFGPATPAGVWAAFGLPQPDNGQSFKKAHDAKAYIRVLSDGWSDPSDLARHFEAATGDEPPLKYIGVLRDSFELRIAVDPSLVVAVARPTEEEALHPHERIKAWAKVSEDRFFNPAGDSTETVELLVNGAQLPSAGAWDDVFVLPAPDAVADETARRAKCQWSRVEIKCPELACEATGRLDGLGSADTYRLKSGPGGGVSWVGSISLSLRRDQTSRSRLVLVPDSAALAQIEKAVFVPPSHSPMLVMRQSRAGATATKSAPKAIAVGTAEEPAEETLKRAADYELLVVDHEDGHWEVETADGDRVAGTKDSDHLAWCFTVALVGGETLLRDGHPVVEFSLDDSIVRPINPLVAAALRVMPKGRLPHDMPLLGKLDGFLTERAMDIQSDAAHLGHVLLRQAGEVLHGKPQLKLVEGVFLQENFFESAAPLAEWATPSKLLLEGSSAARLRAAYAKLDLHRACLEASAPDGTPVSLLPLRGVSEEVVEEILEAHVALISEADQGDEEADGFWARFPFCAVVLDQDRNRVRAVLLSPLHPLRLAWRWSAERSLAGLPDTLAEDTRCKMVELVDGSQFPMVGASLGSGRLVSVPVDSGLDQIFIGWAGLVRAHMGDPERLEIPALIAGEEAPFAASSGLNEASVGAALKDFKRLHPEVATLVVDIAAATTVPRAQELDRAVVSVARGLAGDPLTGIVGGLRVRDSRFRDGAPSAAALIGISAPGEPPMKLEWETYDPRVEAPSNAGDAHVRLLQDSPVALAACDIDDDAASAGLPRVPIRRVVARDIAAKRWRFSSRTVGSWAPFTELLTDMETVPNGRAIGITVDNHFPAFDPRRRSRWYVAGDAFLDPRSLQLVANQEGKDLLLWEWRPGFATAAKISQPKIGDRPYVVICRFPASIRTRLDALTKKLRGENERSADSSLIVRTLAGRGIGLNTLLTRDENHAVGALGFYWALGLVQAWTTTAGARLRLCVPMDAVDGLIGLASAAGGPAETNMRADLLLLEAKLGAGGNAEDVELLMVPLEIKAHLSEDGDQEAEAVEQAIATHLRLCALVAADQDAAVSPWVRAIVGIILEAGLTLAPEAIEARALVSRVLTAVGTGKGSLRAGRGVALEFTPGHGASSWHKDDQFGTPAAVVKIDAEGVWAGLGDGTAPTPVTQTFIEAVEWAGAASGQDAVPVAPPAPPPVGPAVGALVSPEGPRPVSPLPGQERPAPDAKEEPPPVPTAEGLPAPFPGSEPAQAVPPASHGVASFATSNEARKAELSRRHGTIMRTLREFNVKVEPPAETDSPFIEGPAVVRYKVRPGKGVTVAKIEGLSDELKLKLALPSTATVSVRVNEAYVEIEVPKPDLERAYFKAEELWADWTPVGQHDLSAPIGVGEDGRTVAIDLASSMSPHLLVGGQTGSGKSQALLAFLGGLVRFHAPSRMKLVLIDPKRTEFWKFADSKHLLRPILYTPREAAEILEAAVKEMESRYKQLQLRRMQGIAQWEASGDDPPPHWVIVIDEYGELTSDPDDKKRLERALIRLGQAARAAGIHVVIATQRPDALVISANLRANLPGKLALRVRSQNESKIILGEQGAEKLAGNGDALLCYGPNRLRLQCALAPG